MSNNIDERIVEMKFNNGQFQNGVKSTLDALGQLTKGLQMKGSASGMADLGNQTESVSGRFSAMGAIAFGALASIGAKAVEVGLQLAKGLTIDPVMQGFGEYETKMGSIQTILANTEKQGTTLDDVSGALNELNTYADKTVYNFAEMTKNIGLFTNAGIGLQESTNMIQGFSNVAAASGTSSQGAAAAAYQLSQALSAGTIRLMDWRSLTNVGMGNKNMQNSLIEIASAMGKFEGSTASASSASKDFNASLEAKWLTADVMQAYLEVMAEGNEEVNRATLKNIGITGEQADEFIAMQKTAEEAATKVRTATQLWGTLQEAVGSGWASTFEKILGDFDEATDLFTYISDNIGGMIGDASEARNAVIDAWALRGGRRVLVGGIKGLVDALKSVVEPISKAFDSVFGTTSQADTLFKLTQGFRDFAKSLVLSEDQMENLKRTFAGVFAIFDVLKTTLGVVFGLAKAVISPFLEMLGFTGGGILGLTGNLGDLLVKFSEWYKQTSFVTDSVKTVNNAIQTLVGWLKTAYNYLRPIVEGGWDTAFSAVSDETDKFKTKLEDLVSGPLENLKTALAGPIQGVKDLGAWFVTAYEAVNDFFRNLASSAESTAGAGYDMGAVAMERVAAIAERMGDILATVGENIRNGLGKAWDFLVGIGERLRNAFGWVSDMFSSMDSDIAGGALNIGAFAAAVALIYDLIKSSGFGGLGEAITDAIDGFGDAMGAFQKSVIASAVLKIAIALAVLAGSLYLISLIPSDKLAGAGIAMGAMAIGLGVFFKMLKGFAEAEKNADLTKMNAIAAALLLLGGAMLLFAIAGSKFAEMDMDGVVKALLGLTGALAATNLAKRGQVDAIALFTLALAFKTIASAAAELTAVSWNDMAKLGAIMAAFLASMFAIDKMNLGAAEKNILKVAGAMLIISFAMNALAASIKIMSYIDWQTFADGLGKMAAIMILIGYSFNAFPEKDVLKAAAAMLVIGFAMQMLVIPITALGFLPYEKLGKGLFAITIAMFAIAVAVKAMEGAVGGAAAVLAVAFALGMLAPVIIMLGSMPWEVLGLGIAALVVGLGALAAVSLYLAPAAIPMLLFATALMLIGSSVMVAGMGIGFLATGIAALVAVGVGGVYVFIEAMGVFLEALPGFAVQIATFLITIVTEIVNQSDGLIEALTGMALSLIESLKVILPPLIELLYQLIEDLLDGLFTMLDENMGEWTEKGMNALASYLEGVAEYMPRVIDAATDIIVAFLEGLAEDMEDIVTAGGDVILGFLEGTEENLDKIIPAATDVVVTLIEGIGASMGDIAVAGAHALVSFIDGIIANLAIVTPAVGRLIVAFTDSVIANLDIMIQSGTRIIIAFIEGIGAASLKIITAAGETLITFMNGIEDWIRNNTGRINDAGIGIADAIVDGMVSGITGGLRAVTNAAKNIADSAVGTVKGWLGINSPSRVFKEIGEFVTEGFVQGILGTEEDVVDAFDVYRDAIKDVVADTKDNVKDLKESVADYKQQLKDMEDAKLDNQIAAISARDALANAKEEYKADGRRIAYLEKRNKLTKEESKELKDLKKNREAERFNLKKLTRNLDEAREKRAENYKEIRKTQSALAAETKTLKQAQADLKTAQAAEKQYNAVLKERREELTKLAADHDAVNAKLEEANESLDDAIAKRDNYRESMTDKYDDFASISSDTKLSDYLQEMRDQVDKTNALRVALDRLGTLGLNDKLYQQLAEQGTDALPFISQLLEGGQAAIEQINSLNGDLDRAADGIGNVTADQLYQAGVDAAQGLVDGLKSESDAIAAEMEKIAESIVSAIKKTLKIKSPSRVLTELGEYAGQGLVNGLKSMEADVVKSAEDIANSSASALEEAMGALNAVVVEDIDITPRITPVLDLSAVNAEAAKLPGMFDSASKITPTTSTANANSAYDAYSANKDAASDDAGGMQRGLTFIQNNNSPKALSSVEIYRQTNNQISQAKGALTL